MSNIFNSIKTAPETPQASQVAQASQTPQTPQTLSSWSFSQMTEFEKCKYRTYLLHVEKAPEPQRPLPRGKTEHANDRGTRIHTEAEMFIKGEGELTQDLLAFKDDFEFLHGAYKEGKVSLEGEWGMDELWGVTEWKTAWLRLKLDALYFADDTHATAIDFKTGRKIGNEVKHAEQLQLYQLVTFLRYPELQHISAQLWYLDQNDKTTRTYTRQEGLRFLDRFDTKGHNVTSNTNWSPNPSIFTCKWCMYGPWGSGHCTEGVKK